MTKTLFAYGTLLHPDVRSVVLGDDTKPSVTTATLRNHACLKLPDESYPVLAYQPGSVATGCLIGSLSEHAWARIDFFESDEYRLTPIQVDTPTGPMQTWCYGAGKVMPGAKEPWDLEVWQTHHLSAFLKMISHYMALFGKMDIDAAEKIWEQLQKEQG